MFLSSPVAALPSSLPPRASPPHTPPSRRRGSQAASFHPFFICPYMLGVVGILSCRDCKMRILVAVSVRELKFVGVGFEKTRNLKLVTQNFFVPLHPEIGLRPFFLRFATKAAEPSAKPFGRSMRFARSMQQSCVQSPAGVQRCCAAEKSKFRK